MNQQQQESLSALFDGESSEFETRRILSEMDDAGRQQWQRYQMISDAASNQLPAGSLNINIADAVSAAIADEPVLNVNIEEPQKKRAVVSWLKPVAGFAAAASIAFVTVLGVQQTETLSTTQGFVANGNVSASQLQISGGLGLNQASAVASLPLNSEIDSIDAQKQREQQRLNVYLQQHAQHASFNNGRGLLPMARMTKEAY